MRKKKKVLPENFKDVTLLIQVLLVVIAPLLTFAASQKSLKASPYEALASRVTALEGQVKTLEDDNCRLKNDNETLKTQIMVDRNTIRRLISYLSDLGIKIPNDLYPNWWENETIGVQ